MTKQHFWALYPGVRDPRYFNIVGLFCWQYKYTLKQLYLYPPSILQHLQALPDPARTRALHNAWWEDINTRYISRQKALRQAFNWSRSPEGYKYWQQVHDNL